jgi:hypothetical protein
MTGAFGCTTPCINRISDNEQTQQRLLLRIAAHPCSVLKVESHRVHQQAVLSTEMPAT